MYNLKYIKFKSNSYKVLNGGVVGVFEDLPQDMINEISQHFNFPDLINLKLTNKQGYNVATTLIFDRYPFDVEKLLVAGVSAEFKSKVKQLKNVTSTTQLEGFNNLTHLTFAEIFMQEIDLLQSLQSLQSLTLGLNFNLSIDHLPQTLKSLTLGYYFNQPIDNLPQSLQSLTLGYYFNQPIDNLPQSLQSLTLPVRYNLPLDHLPQTIKIIRY